MEVLPGPFWVAKELAQEEDQAERNQYQAKAYAAWARRGRPKALRAKATPLPPMTAANQLGLKAARLRISPLFR